MAYFRANYFKAKYFANNFFGQSGVGRHSRYGIGNILRKKYEREAEEKRLKLERIEQKKAEAKLAAQDAQLRNELKKLATIEQETVQLQIQALQTRKELRIVHEKLDKEIKRIEGNNQIILMSY